MEIGVKLVVNMKFKSVLFVLVLFLFFFSILIVYFKFQLYKVQIRNITSELNSSRADNNKSARDLINLKMKYSACINDQIINADPTIVRGKHFNFEEIDIYSPLLATQSGVFDVWDYKGITQTNYQANLIPYNDFRILVIFYKTKLPYLFSDCRDSSVDDSYSVCSSIKLDLSEFSFKGMTKKGLSYYQKKGIADNQVNKTEYTTIIQLPLTEKKENRIVRITYIGKATDQDYQQYLSLIDQIDIKSD